MNPRQRTESTGSHDANWKPPKKDHPALKVMLYILLFIECIKS